MYKKMLFLILFAGLMFCLPGCDDDDEKCLCPELTYDSTLVGDWTCIYREGDFIGGEGQDQLYTSYRADSTYEVIEIEVDHSPDTGNGTYTLINDTLTMTSDDAVPIIMKFECYIDGNHMNWSLGSGYWVFVRDVPE